MSDRIGHPGIDAAHGDIAQRLKAVGGFPEIGEDAVDAVGGRRGGDLVEADFRAVELDAADLEALLPVAHAVPQAGDGRARVGIKGARQERHPVLVLPGREGRDVAGIVHGYIEGRHERVVGIGAEHGARAAVLGLAERGLDRAQHIVRIGAGGKAAPVAEEHT